MPVRILIRPRSRWEDFVQKKEKGSLVQRVCDVNKVVYNQKGGQATQSLLRSVILQRRSRKKKKFHPARVYSTSPIRKISIPG